MRFVKFLIHILTWWNSQTPGTRFFTWRKGERVGEDGEGNIYYKERGGDRRWVIYNGLAEPSRVSADWHGWLHHTVDIPPVDEDYQPKDWQIPHRANYTGTPYALRPGGSLHGGAGRQAGSGEYEAWTPEG